MQQIAQMLHFGLNSLDNFDLICCKIESFDELFPVNEGLNLVVTVIQKQIDLL